MNFERDGPVNKERQNKIDTRRLRLDWNIHSLPHHNFALSCPSKQTNNNNNNSIKNKKK